MQQLCKLLQQIVLGHILNPGLELTTIFNSGLCPVLRACGTDANFSSLAIAMLGRLAEDSCLLPTVPGRPDEPPVTPYEETAELLLHICCKLRSNKKSCFS